ncbi:hypothetical protein BH160DRAFT_4816 [Burkholderia sp. H160]|nr:hypothetical protein BH160DRAFT_4816 [Burkholderia sp. H160]
MDEIVSSCNLRSVTYALFQSAFKVLFPAPRCKGSPTGARRSGKAEQRRRSAPDVSPFTREAFAQVVDSMFNQHAKWLDVRKSHAPWLRSVTSAFDSLFMVKKPDSIFMFTRD